MKIIRKRVQKKEKKKGQGKLGEGTVNGFDVWRGNVRGVWFYTMTYDAI